MSKRSINHQAITSNIIKSYEASGRTHIGVMCELIDNSIDAGATTIQIVFYGDDITVLDNGCGMNANEVIKSLSIGHSQKLDASIGGYGVGMKSAMQLAEYLSVFSSQNKKINGTVFDKALMQQNGNTYVTFTPLDSEIQSAKAKLNHFKTGTIITLSRLRISALEKMEIIQSIQAELGIKYCKLLQNGTLKLSVQVNALIHDIKPLDVINKKDTNTKLLFTEEITVPCNGTLKKATVNFYYVSNVQSDPLSHCFSKSQGLYIFRGGRLLDHWSGVPGSPAHATSNNFRAELISDHSFDDVLNIPATKDRVPQSVAVALVSAITPLFLRAKSEIRKINQAKPTQAKKILPSNNPINQTNKKPHLTLIKQSATPTIFPMQLSLELDPKTTSAPISTAPLAPLQIDTANVSCGLLKQKDLPIFSMQNGRLHINTDNKNIKRWAGGNNNPNLQLSGLFAFGTMLSHALKALDSDKVDDFLAEMESGAMSI